jgi:predicted metalloprotease
MDWRRGSRRGNIEDRRGMRSGGGGIVGGSLGGLALGLIGYFLFGINPLVIMQMAEGIAPPPVQEAGRAGTPADEMGRFVDTILTSTADVWNVEFQKMGRSYREPAPLVLYEQATGTACGMGQSAMGPFYCPPDTRIYIDLEFFRELGTRFNAPGDFAQAYVLAHEVGHHVQNLLGASDRARQLQRNARTEAEANRYSVALELQADCYAGVWAARAADVSGGRVALEAGDLQEGLRAAAAVGDDTLQRQSRGRVMPDSFTHGSAEQRQRWLQTGYSSGSPAACDTFRER